MNTVLLAVNSCYEFHHLLNFSIKFSCCISSVDGRAMAKMDSVTLHNESRRQGRVGLVGGHMTPPTVHPARLTNRTAV